MLKKQMKMEMKFSHVYLHLAPNFLYSENLVARLFSLSNKQLSEKILPF